MKRHLILAVGVVLFISLVFAWSAKAAPASPNPYIATQPPTISPRLAQEVRRQEAINRLRLSSEMHLFRDRNGVPILTNRPEKYRNRKEYVEIVIKYRPISIPSRFRALTSATQYTNARIIELVRRYSRMYALDENLVYAVIRAESDFNPYAVSSKGARGLMQLMPSTAEDMGVENVFDPAQNIAGGTQYLAKMLILFDNNRQLALAAYNAGPETVKKYGGIPPIPETQNYVRLVQQFYQQYTRSGVRPTYAVGGALPAASYLPSQDDRYYIIHFKNGLTQPAERVVEEKNLYFVTIQGTCRAIRKDIVQTITPPKRHLADVVTIK